MKNDTDKRSKLLAVMLACLLLMLTLAGCGGKRTDAGDAGTMPTIDEAGDITLPTMADPDGGNSSASGSNEQKPTDPNTGETQKPTDNGGNSGNGGNNGSTPTPGSLG